MNTLEFRRLRAAFVLLCLLPAALSAVEVRGLYEGQVEVAGEQLDERIAAQGRALRQVLGKLSGSSHVAGTVVDAAAAQPQRYLQQFSYRQSKDPAGALTLWASFEAAAVDALMREANLPVWSGQRPAVLVWLALASTGAVELLTPDSGVAHEAALMALERRAWERGIPIVYPLLDLEDRARIQAADVWQHGTDKIEAASVRYGNGAALVGAMELSSTAAWSARWSMIESGQVSQWTTQGLTAAAAVSAALDVLADRLSARYAIMTDGDAVEGGASIDLRIVGVRTLKDYARTLRYLNGLDQISALVVRAARNDELRLRLLIRGGVEGLKRVTAFSDTLVAESVAGQDGVQSFRLLP
ncbi:MAG: hypothetical protein ACI8W7_001615 [Gammaproteobacteria bacterium]|jgi:hypothetical protein